MWVFFKPGEKTNNQQQKKDDDKKNTKRRRVNSDNWLTFYIRFVEKRDKEGDLRLFSFCSFMETHFGTMTLAALSAAIAATAIQTPQSPLRPLTTVMGHILINGAWGCKDRLGATLLQPSCSSTPTWMAVACGNRLHFTSIFLKMTLFL